MIVQGRHEAILQVLRRKPRLALGRLQKELGVSRSTLRRDLVELEHLGEVVRIRGGVMHAEFVKGEPSFDRRRAVRVEEKKAIARAAAELVPENATVYIDAGSTCLELGRVLLRRPDLHLFTNSVRLLSDANTIEAEASLVCVGGEYRRASDAVVGGLAAFWLDKLRFDVCFVAASGLDAGGCSTTALEEAMVKQLMIKKSNRAVLIADSGKWGQPSTVAFAPWGSVSTWVCDCDLAKSAVETVRLHGTDVILAN